MTRQRLAARILHVLRYVALDTLETLAHFAAIALLTVVLRVVLPLGAALGISILAVCACHGYLIDRRINRARMRGETR